MSPTGGASGTPGQAAIRACRSCGYGRVSTCAAHVSPTPDLRARMSGIPLSAHRTGYCGIPAFGFVRRKVKSIFPASPLLLLLATSRHPVARNRLPLYPQQRTFRGPRWTSGFDPGCVKTRTPRPSAQQLNSEGDVGESLLRLRSTSRINISSRSPKNSFYTVWVTSGSPAWASECPLLGVKRKSNSGGWMSACSQNRK